MRGGGARRAGTQGLAVGAVLKGGSERGAGEEGKVGAEVEVEVQMEEKVVPDHLPRPARPLPFS